MPTITYNGFEFPTLRGKIRFGTFFGETAYVLIMLPLDASGVSDLVGFIQAFRNEYSRIVIDVSETQAKHEFLAVLRGAGAEVFTESSDMANNDALACVA